MFDVHFLNLEALGDIGTVNEDTISARSDWGMYLAERKISTPEIKTAYIAVPGMDGVLDYTDYFGWPRYKNRSIELTLLYPSAYGNHLRAYQKVCRLHGHRHGIVFGDAINAQGDPDSQWYWKGRVNVGPMEFDRGAMKVRLSVDADPYKTNFTDGTRDRPSVASGSWVQIGVGMLENEIVLGEGGKKPFVPVFNTYGTAFTYTFTIDETTYTGALAATEDDQIIDDFVVRVRELISVKQTSGSAAHISMRWKDEAL